MNGNENIGKIICYNKCILNENKTEITFNPLLKSLDIKVSYIGKGNIYAEIKDKSNNIVNKQKVEYTNEIIRVSDLNSFEQYEINIYEKSKGLSLNSKRSIGKFNEIFYAYDDFVDKRFRINSVDFDQNIHNKFKRVNYNFKRTYLTLTTKTGDTTYLGNIYHLDHERRVKLFEYNPVEVELTSDPYDHSIEASITKDGDGLLMDFKRRSISNDLDDKNGIDIFSYFIDLKGAVL